MTNFIYGERLSRIKGGVSSITLYLQTAGPAVGERLLAFPQKSDTSDMVSAFFVLNSLSPTKIKERTV